MTQHQPRKHQPSMGPGSFDPGSKAHDHRTGRHHGAFNGAGVFRPRKSAMLVLFPRWLCPSMGPGSFDPGSVNLFRCIKEHSPPSMGPGSFDPGSDAINIAVINSIFLQWGRGLSTPEVLTHLRQASARYPFNGAGVFRPRKWPGLWISGWGAWSLQWGRGLSTPEVHQEYRNHDQEMRPSMGPGSFDPGSAPGVSQSRSRDAPFNGAGVFRPRKSAAADADAALAAPSMGPGSFDPGSVAPRLPPRQDRAPFNGAGVFRPRKLLRREPNPLKLPTFNGAGVFRPRKSHDMVRQQAAFAPSMGPGSFDPGSA